MYRFTGAVMVLSFLSVAAFAQEADMIFTGADVVTMNPNQPNAEAVAVKDGRILAVGTAAELVRFTDGRARGADQLIMGYGYDENLMPKGHPLTRYDLDKAFPDTPVLVMHVSLDGQIIYARAGVTTGYEGATHLEQLNLLRDAANWPIWWFWMPTP